MANKKIIPLYRPTITKKDLISVLNCLVDEHISDQSLTKDFEKKINQLIKARNNVITVNNVVAAVYLIFKVIDVKPNEEIILSPLADYYILEVINLFKAKPIWVDLEMGSLKMNVNEIKAKISNQTKAILISHLFGYPFNLKNLDNCNLKEKKIIVIEDNTSVLGTQKVLNNSEQKEDTKWIGNTGDFGFYCFDSKRILTMGNGGAIVTNNKIHSKSIRSIRSYTEPVFLNKNDNQSKEKFQDRLNFLLNDINAALGISELSLLKKFIKRRKEIRKYYCDVLMKGRHSFFHEEQGIQLNGIAFPVIFASGIATAKNMFAKANIKVANLEFGTILENLPYQEELKVINELNHNFLQIPIYPTLSIEEINRITKVLTSIP